MCSNHFVCSQIAAFWLQKIKIKLGKRKLKLKKGFDFLFKTHFLLIHSRVGNVKHRVYFEQPYLCNVFIKKHFSVAYK